MAPTFEQLKVLLIQIREIPSVEREEQFTFLERCGLESHQMQTVNVLRDKLDLSIVDGFDAVMIGGAGGHSAAEDYPWMPDLSRLIVRLCEDGIPLFGSCWGHQYIAKTLGGEVINDPERAELGCHEVFLTEDGTADPLFGRFPSRFLVNQGHHDRVSRLPEDAVELATNDTAPFQSYRVDDLPVYCTQFHSELDATRERERLIAYRDYYPELKDQDVFESILNGLSETTEVDGLLHAFLMQFAVEPEYVPRQGVD